MTEEERILLYRFTALMGPLALALLVAIIVKPEKRRLTGALLAFLWFFCSLSLLHFFFLPMGFWSYQVRGGYFLGAPLDFVLGWAVIWGVLPMLLYPRGNLLFAALLLFWLDWIIMPQFAPVVHMGPYWYPGDVMVLTYCFFPAQLLGRWTHQGRMLKARATLQFLLFTMLIFGIITGIILEQTQASGISLLAEPVWRNCLLIQLMVLAGVPGMSAVQEFVNVGQGTPLPYDPPRRLVQSGVYAYIANPMQASLLVMFILWGILLGSWWVLLGGLMTFAYGAGLAAWDEEVSLVNRFGENWNEYRRNVRHWIPRFRPYVAPGSPTAFIYLDSSNCSLCAGLARWLDEREPLGLTLREAQDHHGSDLSQLTYYSSGGRRESGVYALGRALEHLHLGWALIGFLMRLPILGWFIQILGDVSGPTRHQVKGRT